MDAGETIFPFGMHKGHRLRDIPVGYLDWALGIDLMPELRSLNGQAMTPDLTKRDVMTLE